MSSQETNLTCPHCGTEFDVADSLRTHIEHELRAEIQKTTREEYDSQIKSIRQEEEEKQEEQKVKTADDVEVDWRASLKTGHVNAARAFLHAALWRTANLHKDMPLRVVGVPPTKQGCKKRFQSMKVFVTKAVA